MYQKIKSLADARNESIYAMCKATGIPDNVISNLKNDPKRKGLSAVNLIKVAEYYGVSPNYFIDDKET